MVNPFTDIATHLKVRVVYRELHSGGNFGSSLLRREIGIGHAERIDEIIIQWPCSGITQVLKDITPNQYIRIIEGKDGSEPLALNKISWKKAGSNMPMCAPVQ